MASENIITITKDNFEDEVVNSSIPVMVDFWAPWCNPCRMIGPFIEQLADEFLDKAKVGKINVDEQPDLAIKYGVMTIPTVIVFKNGEEVEKSIGTKGKADFAEMINKYI